MADSQVPTSEGKRSRGRPKTNTTRISLQDHRARDLEGTSGRRWAVIDLDQYPKDSLSYKERVEQLRAEQRARNEEWKREKHANALDVARGKVPAQAHEGAREGAEAREATLPQEMMPPLRMTSSSASAMQAEVAPLDKNCKLSLDEGTGNTVLLVASSKAGKTHLMMYLYTKYFTSYISIMFAHNPHLAAYKAKNLIVTDTFERDFIELMREINVKSKNKFEFLAMFDDQLNLKGSDAVTDLFLSLRNSKISSMISLQYVNLMSKACRGNVNTILGGAMNSDENIEVFIRCYLQSYMRERGIRDIGAQIAHYRASTADHTFFNIHPSSGKVSRCRAPAAFR